MVPKLKQVYFPLEGRGEIFRMICVVGGLEFEEEIIPFADWMAKKANYPYGALPVLIVDDTTVIPQTLAIARYAAKLANLAGKDDVEAAQMDAIVDAANEMFSDYHMIWAHTVMNSSMEDFKKVVIMRRGEEAKKYEGHPELKAEAYKAYAEKAVNPKLDKFEAILDKSKSGWLVGEKLSWADVYLAEFMHRLETHVEPKALANYPKVKALVDKIYAIPVVVEFKNKGPHYEF